MRVQRFLSRMPIALVAMLLVLPLMGSEHEGVFEKTLSVTPPVELDVTAESGSIQVKPGSSGSVHVRGSIKVNRSVSAQDAQRIVQRLTIQPPIEQEGNHIRIGYIKDWSLGGFLSISFDHHPFSISYEIEVPAQIRLRSQTGSGDQVVAGLQESVDVTAGSGSIHLSDLGGNIRASAGSGNVEVNRARGSFDAQTGSGNIVANGIAGPAHLRAGSGHITLEETSEGSIDAETGSGGMEIRGVRSSLRARAGSGDISISGNPAGEWSVQTGSGDVALQIPAQSPFGLDAKSGSGDIESKHSITVIGKVTRNELRGSTGSGGPMITVRTGSGDIQIE